MTDADFRKISQLVYEQCGINLQEGKRGLVKARLGRILREGHFKTFIEYYQHVVKDESGQELIHLLNAISTNFTFFFREQKHFDYLRTQFLPELMETRRPNGRRLRFWSAACSSGEEPYSLAMTLLETIDHPTVWEIEILATDISTKVLKTAESGIYPKERIHSLPRGLIQKYFLKGDPPYQDYVKIKGPVKQYVRFKRLNLMDSFAFQEPFDCVFCRNVMIYFDKKTQGDLVNRLYRCMARGAVLMIGHSESLTGISHSFHYVRPAIYRK